MARQPYLKYSLESMELALKEVRDGRMSRNAASKAFGMPRSTLCDKLDGKTPEDRRMGPPSVLTKAEEAMLANFCIKYLKCGFLINREDLFDIVQRIIQVDGRQTPFTDGRPGYYWFQGFMRRNPALTERSAEILTGGRAAVTEAAIRKWFNDIKTYVVDEEHAGDVFQDPLRIFNFDESNFLLARKKGKVLGPVNYKRFLQSSQENDKEGLTVLMGYSASGKIAPPMIVYSYKQHIPRDVIEAVESADPTWAAGRSDTGWMTSVTFYDYISQVFEPWLTANHVPRPVLVYADGHKSHLSLEIAEFCREKRILLVALYPNSTHLLQPLDVSVFKSLKNLWTTAKNLWKAYNPLANISKKVFPNVFKKAVDQVSIATVVNGFRKTGLYPLDPEQVDYSKCVKDQQVQLVVVFLKKGLDMTSCRCLNHNTVVNGSEMLKTPHYSCYGQSFKMILDLLSMICQVKIFKKQATQVMHFKKQATQVMPFKTQATQVMPFKTHATQVMPFKTQATQVMPFKMQATQVMPFKKQATQVIPFQLKILQLNFFIPMIHVLHLLAITWQITLNHHMKPLQQLILLVTHPMLL
eukprot:Em0024g76a